MPAAVEAVGEAAFRICQVSKTLGDDCLQKPRRPIDGLGVARERAIGVDRPQQMDMGCVGGVVRAERSQRTAAVVRRRRKVAGEAFKDEAVVVHAAGGKDEVEKFGRGAARGRRASNTCESRYGGQGIGLGAEMFAAGVGRQRRSAARLGRHSRVPEIAAIFFVAQLLEDVIEEQARLGEGLAVVRVTHEQRKIEKHAGLADQRAVARRERPADGVELDVAAALGGDLGPPPERDDRTVEKRLEAMLQGGRVRRRHAAAGGGLWWACQCQAMSIRRGSQTFSWLAT
jgi:hypothetical protein